MAGSSGSSAAPRSTPRPGGKRVSPEGGSAQARRSHPNGADPLRMPDGALVAKRDAPVGGQAVLEGVMMRGVSTWAVAVRTPTGEVEVSSEPLVPWAKRHRALAAAGDPRRRRPRRVDEDRLPGAGDLRQRAAGGGRGGRAGGDRRLGLGPDDRLLAAAGDRPLLRRPGRPDQPDQGPARLAVPLLAGRGGAAHGDLHRLHRRDQPPAATCAGSSSTTAPSTRRSPATRPKTSWSRPAPSSTRACTPAAGPASC